MKRINYKSTDCRAFVCPQCDKQRLVRAIDYTPNHQQQDYKTKDNNTVSLHIDICEFCKKKNWRKYFEPTRSDVRRILKAMKDGIKLEENQSLEDLL